MTKKMAKNFGLRCLFILVALTCAACSGASPQSSTNSPTTTSSLSSDSSGLALSTTNASVDVLGSFPFSATGGVAPYRFYMVSGGGSINLSSGIYVAPVATGSAQIAVEDASGNDAYADIKIMGLALGLTITPASISVAEGSTYTFTVSGGSGLYTFSVASGIGSVNSTTGVYTAPLSAGTASIEVADTEGNTVNAAITVFNPSTGVPTSAPLYREIDSSLGLHMSTLNSGEDAPGYVEQEILLYVYGSQTSSTIVPLYRCGLGNAHFTTTDVTCEGVPTASLEIQMGWIDSVQQAGEVPLYRLHSGGDSMDSLSSTEGTQNGYVLDGITGYAPVTN
jgi:hypothetical protein